MAQFDTIGTVGGARTADIDAGLRAHMNKVYGTMSVGMLITALAAPENARAGVVSRCHDVFSVPAVRCVLCPGISLLPKSLKSRLSAIETA